MKCMFAYWSSYYKYTFVPQRQLAQRLVDLNNRLRLLQTAIQHWKKFVQQSLPPSSPNFLGARRSFVDSSVLRERLLNLQKLQTLFLEWKLAVEADKLLPDVNHLVLCNITAKDKFRKSTRTQTETSRFASDATSEQNNEIRPSLSPSSHGDVRTKNCC